MKVQKYSIQGKVVGDVDLPDNIFGVEVNDVLIYELIKSANANLRQGTHKTKERGEIRGGGAKPWRQKGTGRARAGTSRSPIWRGGGTVFGPRPRCYRVDLPKKMKKAAYKSLFSLKAKEGSIKIIEDFESTGKTKEVASIGKALSVKKGLLISNGDDMLLRRAVNNIGNIAYNNVERLYSRDLFYSKDVIITESALKLINEKYAEGK